MYLHGISGRENRDLPTAGLVFATELFSNCILFIMYTDSKILQIFLLGKIQGTARFVRKEKNDRSLYENKPAVKVLLVPLIG